MSFDILTLLRDRGGERFQLHNDYLNSAFVRMLKAIGYDVAFDRGEGPYLYDSDGRRYLDLLSGYGVFAVGRNHPTVNRALHQILDAELANLVQFDVSPLSGLLAESLLSFVPSMERAFFCNSGTEAVEAAIKFSRAATGRDAILYCDHAFHGLSTGSLALNGETMFRQGFGSLLPNTRHVPFDDLAALEEALAARDIAAFIVEPIQGKTVQVPSDGYLAEAARLCRKHGTLFVLDEIQTGMGRTGKFLCADHWNVEADMVLLAKALSGGHVPVGAVLARKWIYEKIFDRMDRAVVHGSTFGKTDLAMAAGLATLAVLKQERLIDNAAALGQQIQDDFRAIASRSEFVADVRGKGLMIGIEFGKPRSLALQAGWKLVEAANTGLFCQMILIPLFKKHAILCQVAGYKSHVIKLLPSLTIGESDRTWIRDGFTQTILDCQKIHSAVWGLGRDLVGSALKVRAG